MPACRAGRWGSGMEENGTSFNPPPSGRGEKQTNRFTQSLQKISLQERRPRRDSRRGRRSYREPGTWDGKGLVAPVLLGDIVGQLDLLNIHVAQYAMDGTNNRPHHLVDEIRVLFQQALEAVPVES